MRVVHLMGPLRASGMERMFISAAPYFSALGVDSTIVGQGPSHPFRPDLEAGGYRVRIIEPIKSLRGLSSWSELLRESAPDVVHIHTEEAFVASIRVAHHAAPTARIVRTFHSYFEASGWWAVKRRLQAHLSDHLVETFVALSPDMAEHERAFGRHCEVIPNWVDDHFLTGSINSPTSGGILLVGNCEPVKRHESVLLCALRNEWPIAHVGDEASASPRERQQLDQLQERGLLTWRGTGNPRAHMRDARLFVMPSEREGYPVSLAEAIAMGMSCLVSEARGFAWAGGYPLVASVKGRDAAAWEAAIRRTLAVDPASTLRTEQRRMALSRLAARTGAEKYAVIYRGGTLADTGWDGKSPT